MNGKPATGRLVLESARNPSPPRYPVRSLNDDDLAHEIASADQGPWLDACLAEFERREAT